jgi:hypothetical protein
MDFKYTFVGNTKRYAKFEPNPGQGITGAFYLEQSLWEKAGKPEQIELAMSF